MKISERLLELAATHGWDDIALKSIVEAIEKLEQTHDEASIDQIPGYKALQRIKHISTTFGTIATLPEIARLSTDAVAEIESRYVQRNNPSRSIAVIAGEAFVSKFKREPTFASDSAWMNGFAQAWVMRDAPGQS